MELNANASCKIHSEGGNELSYMTDPGRLCSLLSVKPPGEYARLRAQQREVLAAYFASCTPPTAYMSTATSSFPSIKKYARSAAPPTAGSSQIDLVQTRPHIYASMEPAHAATSRTVLSPPPCPVPARIRTMSQRASTEVDTNAAAVGLFDAQVLQVQNWAARQSAM
ncbi:hypothetical protein B0H13DRAFT_1877715 [Mycena leptocephala]|nr:hypothetical protein B0H13DRAFT_1877715 [Mycena leptocephala]